MELRPRKGRSAQPPSTPTIAKSSPRPPPQSSSRKKPAPLPSTSIHIPSDDEDEGHPNEIHADPKEICPDPASKGIHADKVADKLALKQGNQDILLPDSSEFKTPLSSVAKLRRAQNKVASSNVKAKSKVTSSVKKNMAEEMGSTPVSGTHIANDTATSKKIGLDEAMTKKVFGTDIASEETDIQDALKGSVPQNSDELAVEITFLAQEVCSKETEVLSPSSDSKQVHSSNMKSAKKNNEDNEVVDAKLDHGGDQESIIDVDAPIVSESEALSLVLSDDEKVIVLDGVQVDGCKEKISASKEAALERRLLGADVSKASSASKKSQSNKKDIKKEESLSRKLFKETSDATIPCTDTEPNDQSRFELGWIADSSKEGVTKIDTIESSDEDSRDERHGDISNEHAKLNATIACSQSNVVHDEEISSSDGDEGNASSGSDDDDEDEMASVFFSSMKAHLQKISEPSGLSMQKDEQEKQDALIRLESQLTKSAVKKPSANGGLTGYGLSWSPEIVLSSSKNSKAQVGKPRSTDTIWGKDRCLQDGLCVRPVDPLKLNKLARNQKDDTAGAKWFNLSAPTITPEIKKELQLVKLRGALDPKRHYKADDSKGLPKFFQIGTVVGGPADFYSGRLTKKEQKSSLASELLSDSSLTAYRKRKYIEIQDQKQAGGKGFWNKKKSKRTPAWAKI